MVTASTRELFLDMISRPDGEIDLVEAALLIAKEEYTHLDVPRYQARLERLAEEARPRLSAAQGNPFAVIDVLNSYLFREQGFRGNQEEYFDPRNSYLNQVLDRRRGIPVTLSLIYIEVAARLDFPLQGVGLPGHFIVRHASQGREILIDPYHAGAILLHEECRQRLRASSGHDLPLEPRFLQAVGKKQMVIRMLLNLKQIYLQAGDSGRALSVIERLLALSPDDSRHLRDRGLAHMSLSHYGRAVEDLESYLHREPEAGDESAVRKKIKAIRRMTAMLS